MGVADFIQDPMGMRYKKKSWNERLGITAAKKKLNKKILGPFRALSPSRQWRNFKMRTKKRLGYNSEFAKAYRSGEWGKYAKRKMFGESEEPMKLIMPFGRLLEAANDDDDLEENYDPYGTSPDEYRARDHEATQSGPTKKGFLAKHWGKALVGTAALGYGAHKFNKFLGSGKQVANRIRDYEKQLARYEAAKASGKEWIGLGGHVRGSIVTPIKHQVAKAKRWVGEGLSQKFHGSAKAADAKHAAKNTPEKHAERLAKVTPYLEKRKARPTKESMIMPFCGKRIRG